MIETQPQDPLDVVAQRTAEREQAEAALEKAVHAWEDSIRVAAKTNTHEAVRKAAKKSRNRIGQIVNQKPRQGA